MSSASFFLRSRIGVADSLVTHGWVEMTVIAPSQAGEHRLQLGTSGSIRVPPGMVATHLVAPQTRVAIQSDSPTDVEWGFLFTELPGPPPRATLPWGPP